MKPDPKTLKEVLKRHSLIGPVAKRAKMTYTQVWHVLNQNPPTRPDHLEAYGKRLSIVYRAAEAVLQSRRKDAVRELDKALETLSTK